MMGEGGRRLREEGGAKLRVGGERGDEGGEGGKLGGSLYA